MKIVRTIVLVVLFVACVAFATANSGPVSIVFPKAPFELWPETPPAEVPLFVVVLATLVLGVMIGGLGSLFENLRLRAGTRKARKMAEKAHAAREAAEEESRRLQEELARARADVAAARSEALESTRAVEAEPIEAIAEIDVPESDEDR